MAGGHTVHKRAAISLTMVVIPHTFCMENEKGVDTLRSMAIMTWFYNSNQTFPLHVCLGFTVHYIAIL